MPNVRRAIIAGVACSVAATGAALAVPSNAASTAPAASKAHHPVFMPTLSNLTKVRTGKSPLSPALAPSLSPGDPVQPPTPPCVIPVTSIPSVDTGVIGSTPDHVGPCVSLPETPATGQPFMGNMAYWGGRVQVHPHIYLVFFGWDRPGAFDYCFPSTLNEGAIKATLKCDPDGAGKRMADFVSQLGGTRWAGIQSQYYQIVQNQKTFISNDKNQLAGIWVDDANPVSAKISYRDMAREAERAAVHFHVPDSKLIDSNFVIVQPKNFSDPVAQADGYCAFHDLIEPSVDAKDYKGLKPGVPYTNMPYVLNQGNNCGAHLVNKGNAGKLDGFTVALGHEIEETVTDPGAEDHVSNVSIGGWYDPFDGNENGDKCAYVGEEPITGTALPEPGAAGNIKGNRGDSFPVQSLWSNAAAGGAGYCAGTNNDLPN
ncbi:MAG: hypothetical protein JO074_02725 [Frankiales bacterium]|nr:hypothetical protein [Frankiales bacterium]